jgi:hypothetical protein
MQETLKEMEDALKQKPPKPNRNQDYQVPLK